jgi:uncharacterized coiled-coil protein SlyX
LRKAELNSWKAATSNEARVYQDFCDRNLALKKREDELLLSISRLEVKKAEIKKTISELEHPLVEHQEINAYNEKSKFRTENRKYVDLLKALM